MTDSAPMSFSCGKLRAPAPIFTASNFAICCCQNPLGNFGRRFSCGRCRRHRCSCLHLSENALFAAPTPQKPKLGLHYGKPLTQPLLPKPQHVGAPLLFCKMRDTAIQGRNPANRLPFSPPSFQTAQQPGWVGGKAAVNQSAIHSAALTTTTNQHNSRT